MASPSITFKTLIDRNDDALERLQLNPPKRGAEDKRSALLEERATIDRLASPERQIERYGAQRWQEEFIRLKDIADLPLDHPQSHALRGTRQAAQVLKAIGNVPFMRFQRAFSDPENIVVPSYSIDRNGAVIFECPDILELSVCGCLVDPQRIPEKLAEDLKLVDFTGDKRKPKERLFKLADPETLDAFKALFDKMIPLSKADRAFRVLLLPASRFAGDDPRAGAVIVTSDEGRSRGRLSSLKASYFDDVYSSKRRIMHSSRGYSRETAELAQMEESVRSLSNRIQREWRDAPEVVKEVLREETEALLIGYKEMLERVQNVFKSEAADFMEAAHTLRDATGRLNPRKTVLQMNASVDRLKKRLFEICKKESVTQQDKLLIEAHISRAEQGFRGLRHRLERNGHIALTLLSDPETKLFSGAEMSREEIVARARGITARLGIHEDDFSRVESRPFYRSALAMRGEMSKLSEALLSRDRNSAKQALNGIQLVLKVNAVIVGIEHLKEAAAQGQEVPISRLRDLASTLSTVLDEKSYYRVSPSEKQMALTEALAGIRTQVKRMAKALVEYAKTSLSVQRREELNTRFKEFLDGLNYDHLQTILCS
ncbi:MAG: hypothetical protein KDD64_11355 [Bdellovibrionales bacterium]|nr:hypothetical protein [Bdellovibrionales bacterium]